MPPKRNTSRNSQSDSGPITDLSQNELRRLIQEEVKATIKDEVDALSSRLGNIEQQMKLLADLKATVDAVETSITYTSGRIDDLCKNSWPILARHIQEVTTGLALQTMDLDVHRRKWSLTIHGLKGEAGEDEVTRDASVKLAKDHLGISDAATTDFAACHCWGMLSNCATTRMPLAFHPISSWCCALWKKNCLPSERTCHNLRGPSITCGTCTNGPTLCWRVLHPPGNLHGGYSGKYHWPFPFGFHSWDLIRLTIQPIMSFPHHYSIYKCIRW